MLELETIAPAMLKIETEREEDGRWIAEVPALPGVVVCGSTEAEARGKVKALALRVIADRVSQSERVCGLRISEITAPPAVPRAPRQARETPRARFPAKN
jgi:predicted RNase H-like HicB family nuclease